ncbi:hypothetical protein ID866_7067 [Astraeus odoratus]|nr:hypothetical protein ID866_7067 [Astraeus odoratus]
MPRELRPRKSRPDYTGLAGRDTDDGANVAGPSSSAAWVAAEDTDSSFTPQRASSKKDDIESSSDVDSDSDMEVDEDVAKTRTAAKLALRSNAASSVVAPLKKRPMEPVGRSPSKPQHGTTISTPALQLPATRSAKTYSLPSTHHRHRAIPIFHRFEEVERLEHPPALFEEPKITFTNSMTTNHPLTDRIGKAWGYNVGPGPVWELLEDRSCYKESTHPKADSRMESSRRPRVYENIKVREGWEVLDYHDALVYLPTGVVTNDEGCSQPPPAVACYMGPYGEQSRVLFNMFDSHCTYGSERDSGEVQCEMILCVENGPAQDIKWCPLPAHDRWADDRPLGRLRKLGILAGTFEDGSLSIYIVPDPTDLSSVQRDTSSPVFVKAPEPALRIELEGTSCWSLDWANSEVLAVGCTNGYIGVYNIGDALRKGIGPSEDHIPPTHFICVHQSAIRAVTWIRVPPTKANGVLAMDEDPTVIASGGYDGVECLTDVREPYGHVVNRTRDVINTTSYSVFAAGAVMIDHDSTVKVYSVSPSMLGRGHTLMEPDGPVWSVSASDYHPQLAVGSADGSCSTTNLLKSTRRGGLVPFFVHKIYQMDFSRKTGEFRMLEWFLPHVTQERGPGAKSKTETGEDDTTGTGHNTGVWPPEIGIHRVAWNTGNGLACAQLLASATGSGLCRVDWLQGRWFRERVPYVSVPKMRREVEGDDDSADDGLE